MVRPLPIGSLSRRAFLVRTGVLAGALAVTRAGLLEAVAQDAPKGGTLAFGHFGDVDNYDPHTNALDLFQNYGRLLVYSSLTGYDPDLKLVGDLASSWELQETNWVFKLRDGVTWHDGSPLTAEDVKYSLERVVDPATGSFLASQVGEGTTVTVVDPLTALINLPAVNASYPDLMTAVSIVKKDSGESNRDKPVGTGPFVFDSWTPNQETRYKKNAAYYDPSIPYLDEIVFQPITDPQVAITNLTAGSVDAISNQLVLPQTAQTLEGQEGVSLIVVDPSTALVYANIIQKEKPLSDKRVRQGLAMCLDLEGIKQLVYAGRGTPTNNIIPSLSWAYTNVGTHPFDPEKAKALFAEAGFPDGFKTSLLTIEGYPDLIAIAPIWQDGLKKAGVECEIETAEINTWIDRWSRGDYQISLNFDINGPDPQRMFVGDLLIHAAAGEWADAELTKRIEDGAAAAVAVADQAERQKVYADLQTYMFDELPNIPIYRPAIVGATSSKVTGFAIDGKGFYHFDRAAVAS